MAYLAGGKDVSDEARESLLRMKQVGSTDNIHVIAQFDSGSEGFFTKRYYLSPFTNAVGIETLLRQACADVPITLNPYASTVGINYLQRLKEALSPSQMARLDKLQTGEIIELLKYSPDRFKSFVLNCILEEDVYPRPSGNLGDTNAGDPEVLVKFVQWAKVRYPAEHYMVILWGHGSGLSVAWDYPSSPFVNTEDALTIQELKKAFEAEMEAFEEEEKGHLKEEEEFRKKEKLPKEEKATKKAYKYIPGVDIVGFNSCSLGTIEVCQQLRKLVKFCVASEGFTPKTSWPYDKILKTLDENSALEEKKRWEPGAFAEKIVEEYVRYYKGPVTTTQDLQEITRKARRLGASLDLNMGWGLYKEKPNVDLSKDKPNVDLSKDKPNVDLGSQGEKVGGGIDLSVCNLEKSGGVTKAMRELVRLLQAELGPALNIDVFAAVLGAHAIGQSYFNRDFTDLYDFCRALWNFCSNRSIKKACEKVMDAIYDMCNDPGYFGNDVSNSFGVSIFFPWSEWGKEDVIARYKQLDFISETKWDEFLKTYRKLACQFEERTGAFKATQREDQQKQRLRIRLK